MAGYKDGAHPMRKLLTMALLGERYIDAFDEWEAGAGELGAYAEDEGVAMQMLDGSKTLPSPDLATGIDPDDLRDFIEEGLVEAVAEDGASLRLTPEGVGLSMFLFNRFAEAIESEFDVSAPTRVLGPTHAFRFSLELEDCECRRELIVPADFMFQEFHEAIQATFGWMDYHLWDFTLRVDGKQITVTDLEANDVLDGEAIELTLEKTVAGEAPGKNLEHQARDAFSYDLDDAFPDAKLATYRYDYGDGWEITIRLEEDIEEYEGPLPTCVGGAGDAPPEDVGGPYGFRDFKRTMLGPQSKRREELAKWAEGQGFEPFSVDRVNRRLEEWGEVALF